MRERATTMLDRVLAEARSVTDDACAARVHDALRLVLATRDELIQDDHDSRLLHPARTIRILIADAGWRNCDALAAAALVDSIDTGLNRSLAGPPQDVLDLVAAVPLPRNAAGDDEDLLERIITAPADAAIIALAERLDHARHLHLRSGPDPRTFHASIRTVYAPAARRFSPPIARRFDRWADAFERRLVLPR